MVDYLFVTSCILLVCAMCYISVVSQHLNNCTGSPVHASLCLALTFVVVKRMIFHQKLIVRQSCHTRLRSQLVPAYGKSFKKYF